MPKRPYKNIFLLKATVPSGSALSNPDAEQNYNQIM